MSLQGNYIPEDVGSGYEGHNGGSQMNPSSTVPQKSLKQQPEEGSENDQGGFEDDVLSQFEVEKEGENASSGGGNNVPKGENASTGGGAMIY